MRSNRSPTNCARSVSRCARSTDTMSRRCARYSCCRSSGPAGRVDRAHDQRRRHRGLRARSGLASQGLVRRSRRRRAAPRPDGAGGCVKKRWPASTSWRNAIRASCSSARIRRRHARRHAARDARTLVHGRRLGASDHRYGRGSGDGWFHSLHQHDRDVLTRRCLEQLAIDLCLHRLPVRLIASGGGAVYAPLGPTHMALDDIALLRALPG